MKLVHFRVRPIRRLDRPVGEHLGLLEERVHVGADFGESPVEVDLHGAEVGDNLADAIGLELHLVDNILLVGVDVIHESDCPGCHGEALLHLCLNLSLHPIGDRSSLLLNHPGEIRHGRDGGHCSLCRLPVKALGMGAFSCLTVGSSQTSRWWLNRTLRYHAQTI